MKLPTARSFGQAPAIRQRPLPTLQTTGVTESREEAAQMADAGEAMLRAGERLAARRDAVAKLRATREYRTQAMDEARRVLSEGDLTDPGTLEGYKNFIDTLGQSTLENFRGGEDARLDLQSQMQGTRFNLINQIATASAAAENKMIETEIGETMNNLAFKVRRDPREFLPAVNELNTYIDALPGDAASKRRRKAVAVSKFAEVATEELIAMGTTESLDAAHDILRTPGAIAQMDEGTQQRLLDSLREAAAPKPGGRVLSEEEAAAEGIQYDPEKGFVTQDANGNYRFQRTEATPLVNLDKATTRDEEFVKGLGKGDADFVSALRTDVEKSNRDQPHLMQLRAALESGGFEPGAFAETRLALSRVADLLGLSTESRLIGNASTAEQIDSATHQLAVNGAEKLSRVTNMSLGFVQRSLPELVKTREGNMVIVEIMQRANERLQAHAEILDDYIARSTLYPENEVSFYQKTREYDEENPVVDQDMLQRIESLSQTESRSLKEILAGGQEQGPPEGFADHLQSLGNDPEEWEFLRMEKEGAIVRRRNGTMEHVIPWPPEGETETEPQEESGLIDRLKRAGQVLAGD